VINLFYEKPYGLLQKGESSLITSSGLGAWGPPIKLGSKVEVVIININ
jgi:predicted MPP superfamily phosphohydrolase